MREVFLMLMRTFRAVVLLLSALALAGVLANAQDDDSPSLGDVARQARLKKQKEAQPDAKDQTQLQTKDQQASGTTSQAGSANGARASNVATSKTPADKDASGNDPLLLKGSKKIITNEEIPEHVGPTSTLPQHPRIPNTPDQPAPGEADGKVPAQYWKNQIRALKESISNLESAIQDATDSIRYAGGSCASNCAQYNAQQQQRQEQVDAMTSQLTQQQKNLESMQETARKQGYSSAVYDP
jgi:hypothetical protein